MSSHWKTTCAAIALLATAGSATAAPKGPHGAGSHIDHVGAPPASSNRQSLPDAERGLERATERESDQGLDHSRAQEQQLEHAPDHGVDHRNTHSMEPQGKTLKNKPN
ncbi:hypothetical protein [Immundisolibacter sp.]|uniref:hypothetical protein n=1 Tax=Immundisolibacter sp. TaxID=1934948 RepID=UPI003568BC79